MVVDSECQVRERLDSVAGPPPFFQLADQSGRDVLGLHCTGLFHYMDLLGGWSR